MKKQTKTRVVLAFFVSISIGLAATAMAQPAKDRLRVGYLPVTGHAKFFVAKEQGLFTKEGLDVELIEFINSADGINALRAGKIDVGAFGTTAPLVHISQGADLKIIGGIMGEDASIIARPDKASSIRTIADLRGKKVATVRLATGDAVLRGALLKEGIDWKTDLKIFELKNPPAVLEAVKSGQVDAGVTWGPHDITAEKEGMKVVIRSHDLSPGHPCCRIAITGSELQGKRNTLTRFLRAILQAEKFTKTNHEATVNAIVKYVKLDRAIIEKAYYHGHLDQSTDPNVEEVKKFWITMQKSEFVKSGQDITKFIDKSLYKSALDSLAKENPKDPFWK
ncbi:MAG: ABC transporter substrate-binding protein, partial [Syntrophales bacterium]|nr:ABC transporter substrate-binding protein [Syntrophales bacterium]